MPEHELMKLLWRPPTEPAMSSAQVVEHEELARLDAHEYLDRLEAKAASCEVVTFVGEAF